jgi:hypothetical protein
MKMVHIEMTTPAAFDQPAGERLPELSAGPPAGDREHRQRALRRLDALLDVLERANLREAQTVPERALAELEVLGLERPWSYSVVQLLEIVFQAQRPFLQWQSSQPQASRPG